jgi:hypothetical protein
MPKTATGEILGYVVVDWNQTSGYPDVDTAGLYTTQGAAEDEAAYRQTETDRIGRSEHHTIAAVINIEED